MSLLFKDKELLELMQDFYILTGIRIVLFDENFVEVISYPTNEETFCGLMRTNKTFEALCRSCDENACRYCRNTHQTYIYTCHAGLTEAVSPVVENGIIIGYIMFGQVTDIKNKQQLSEHLKNLHNLYMPNTANDKKIKYKSRRQIVAASKILDALAEYIHLKGMVHLSNTQIITKINNYINEHITEDITVYDLCNELGLSRTHLYEIMKKQTGEGVSSFIRNKKLEHALQLIRTTELKIPEIASRAGFSDYNYFLRLFKNKYGLSPKKYSQNR